VIEAGVPGMQVMEWYGLLTTGKTPRPVIEKLNTEVAKILNKPDVQAQLIELGAQPVGGSVRDFATQIESDIQMWSKVVKKSAVRAD
jgi:tripartite-type tricarboxylate transporter receptor subunit TctC